MNVTVRLADFIARTPEDSIPEEAREQAKRAFLDTMGVMLAGSREDAASILADTIWDQEGARQATAVGHRFLCPATDAALVNGTSAHALDYDDVTVNMRGHPSVPLVPTILALGESIGSSGREVLDAYVLGFEVQCKLGRAIGEPHYALGWHATSTLGTIGAAAACSRLLFLDISATQAALGIAASLASGLQQNFGTMTKPLHAGWAARNGVVAAQLASRGFLADVEALEGPSGFLRAMSGGAEHDASAAARGLGAPWEVTSPGIGVKLYPCCYAIARAADAAIELHSAISAPIEGVEVIVTPGTLFPLIKRPPETPLEAKFSMEHCIATALLDGGLSLSSFTHEGISREDVRALMERITVREEGEPRDFPIGGVAEVRVTTVNGTESRSVDVPRGDPGHPLGWEELSGKFRECAEGVLGPQRTAEVIAAIEALPDLKNVRRLARLLGGDTDA